MPPLELTEAQKNELAQLIASQCPDFKKKVETMWARLDEETMDEIILQAWRLCVSKLSRVDAKVPV